MYDASDRKQVRKAEKEAKLADAQTAGIIKGLMSLSAGRQWVYDKLAGAHVFATSFDRDPLQMAFAEGERNQGLILLNDVMKHCPDQYLQMTQEANARDTARERTRSTNANGRDSEPSGDASHGGDTEDNARSDTGAEA